MVLFGWLFGGLLVCLFVGCFFVGLLFVCCFCCWLLGHLVTQLVGLLGRKYISKCDHRYRPSGNNPSLSFSSSQGLQWNTSEWVDVSPARFIPERRACDNLVR